MSAIDTARKLASVELRDAMKATQGNLSVHLRKLEEAGYVALDRSIVERKTLTKVRITRSGRKALGDYLDAIARLVEAAAKR